MQWASLYDNTMSHAASTIRAKPFAISNGAQAGNTLVQFEQFVIEICGSWSSGSAVMAQWLAKARRATKPEISVLPNSPGPAQGYSCSALRSGSLTNKKVLRLAVRADEHAPAPVF